MKHAKTTSQKMRGMIEPYTLGFLLSLIGAGIAHLVHADKHEDEVENAAQIEHQADASSHTEDE